MRKLLMLAVVSGLLAGCGEKPIRKTNCWSSMSFVASPDCQIITTVSGR